MHAWNAETSCDLTWFCLARCCRRERLSWRLNALRTVSCVLWLERRGWSIRLPGIPEIAKAAGAYVCEVNPERTPLSDLCDEVLTGKAGEVLPLFSRS